ncbi:hypothetical protein N431DRAFT_409595 [Stipitochalara longipes BDJ]|nr:hypothetical protein N431DRAFT_409595 [Stipitochalara longipes BDJ]
MGKSKSKNRSKYRSNPTARAVKPPSDPELAALRQQRILPVIKDLQSAEVKTRSAAARAITNLIESNNTRKLLLREQIVKILLEQTLTDSNLETRVDGWGILRNLVLAEDTDFCVHLFRRDILTAIESAGKSIIETLKSKDIPFSKLSRSQQELVWTLTSSLITLISCLAEAQDEINQDISRRFTISQFLISLIADESPYYIVVEVLNCMGVLLEDNEELARQVVDDEEGFLNYLTLLKEYTDIKGVTSCQVLHNLCASLKWYDHNTPSKVASIASLLPTLAKAMDQTKQQTTSAENGDSKYSSPDQVVQLALEVTASIATGLHEALEHARKPGNVKNEKEFTGFDDSEIVNDDAEPEEADEDEGDAMDVEEPGNENGEMDEDEMLADMEGVTADGPDDDQDASDSATLNLLIQKSTPSVINVVRQNNDHKIHALSALNNITWAISVIDFTDEHLHGTYELWAKLGQQIWNEIVSPFLASDAADLELASLITSIAWSVSRCVKGGIKIQSGEQRKFMSLHKESKELLGGDKKAADGDGDDFSTLGVKCIGVLGSLALDPAPIRLNTEIGAFLLDILSKLPNTPAAEAVEALDQIFVIYADRAYSFDEPVFWAYNFPKRLEEIQPKLKQTAKGIDKRHYPELRERVDEILLNLHRFLAYKRKERQKTNLIDFGGDSEMRT